MPSGSKLNDTVSIEPMYLKNNWKTTKSTGDFFGLGSYQLGQSYKNFDNLTRTTNHTSMLDSKFTLKEH